MLPINFNSIQNNLTPPIGRNNFSNQLCSDQNVAQIKFCTVFNRWVWQRCYITSNQLSRIDIDYSQNNTDSNCILIVLESPHFDEYDTITHQAKGPAVGSTGKLFEQHFLSIINCNKNIINLNRDLTYDIIFVNSVQYQASQGMKPLKPLNRDKNWLSFWYKGFNTDLCKRICTYDRKTIVINMCTYGQHVLHDRVQRVLRCAYRKHVGNTYNLYQSYHPSTWWIGKRRKIWK